MTDESSIRGSALLPEVNLAFESREKLRDGTIADSWFVSAMIH